MSPHSALTRTEFELPAPSGHVIDGYLLSPPEPVGVIQLVHGMAEHAARYEVTARELAQAGAVVVIHNHRGHGPQAHLAGRLGDLGVVGFEGLITDTQLVSRHVRELYPELPVVLWGHSMGSFVARCVISRARSGEYRGLILTGTGGALGAMAPIMRAAARQQSRKHGATTPSAWMSTLTFGTYNKFFFPNRTEFDWLSKDTAAVDAYMADPLCGHLCTPNFWMELAEGIAQATAPATVAATPSGVDFLLLDGKKDPVGQFGRATRGVYRALSPVMRSAQLVSFPQGRHELAFDAVERPVMMAAVTSFFARVTSARS